MKIHDSKFRFILVLILVSALALSACGGGTPEPEGIEIDLSSPTDDVEQDEPDAGPAAADDYYFIGTNLEGVDVCTLIPREEIMNIVGALREDETEVEISLAGETGCKYVGQDGLWYYLTYYPLGDWEFVEYTLNNSAKVDGLLDGAWMGLYSSDEIHIKALAAEEMVIGAFVSDGSEETATSLIKLAFKFRPQ